MALRLVYVTCETQGEAITIARAVVEDRLAACANVLGEITSVFWWGEAVQEGPEVALILKTRSDLIAPLTERIKELHSYTCPCIVTLPIEEGNKDFLDWIVRETRKS